MPSNRDTSYTARTTFREEVERGSENTLSCPMWRDGAVVAPSAGTATLYDDSDNEVAQVVVGVDAEFTIASSIATWVYTAPASLDLGENYRIEWALTMDGVVHTVRNEAAVVRRRLYCPVADADITEARTHLDLSSNNRVLNGVASLQVYIDRAWTWTLGRLYEEGNRPNLILRASALRETTLQRAYYEIYSDLGVRNAAFIELADRAERRAYEAMARVRLVYSVDDEANPDGTNRRPAVQGTVWLTGRGY